MVQRKHAELATGDNQTTLMFKKVSCREIVSLVSLYWLSEEFIFEGVVEQLKYRKA